MTSRSDAPPPAEDILQEKFAVEIEKIDVTNEVK
jgi:hypothetical protein